jgi:transposase-like protein
LAADSTTVVLGAFRLERFNEEIRRRTYLVRIFPNEASTLRLIAVRIS